MTKKQYIEELKAEIARLNGEWQTMRDQRDALAAELDADDCLKSAQDAAKREAEIQEKVDGIKAGLIPVEELRKHISETVDLRINQERSAYEFKLLFKQTDTDPISIAIRDEILGEHAPKPIRGLEDAIKRSHWARGGHVSGSQGGVLMNGRVA